MKRCPIALAAWMLLILASTVIIGLIISCSSASEAPPAPTKDSTTPQNVVGKGVNSFAQRVNPKNRAIRYLAENVI